MHFEVFPSTTIVLLGNNEVILTDSPTYYKRIYIHDDYVSLDVNIDGKLVCNLETDGRLSMMTIDSFLEMDLNSEGGTGDSVVNEIVDDLSTIIVLPDYKGHIHVDEESRVISLELDTVIESRTNTHLRIKGVYKSIVDIC